MEPLLIPEIIIELLLSCDLETALAFASTNSRLLEIYRDDYYWKRRLGNDFPRYDTSSHQGESFKETYWLIGRELDIYDSVCYDRPDLLVYFTDGEQIDKSFVVWAIHTNSTKVIRWAVENGYGLGDSISATSSPFLTVETMRTLSELGVTFTHLPTLIFSGTKEQIRLLLDGGFTNIDGLLHEITQLYESVTPERREIIDYGLRELYVRRLLCRRTEYEAILLFGEEERFCEILTDEHGRPLLNIVDYVFAYGPDASIDWLIRVESPLIRQQSVQMITPERMDYLLKRGLTTNSISVSATLCWNEDLLLNLLLAGFERELFIALAREKWRRGFCEVKTLFDLGFTVDEELMRELCRDPEVHHHTKLYIKTRNKEESELPV